MNSNKIVILANSVSGLYGFRGELIAELQKSNDVAAYTPLEDDVAAEKLRALGCWIADVKMDRRGVNPIKDIGILYQYLKILLKEKPALVITYTIKPNIYGGIVCRILKKAYAVNITGLGTAFQNRGMLRKLVVFLYKFALKKAKVVYFENSENKQLFIHEKMISESQACLLNGAGVNLERFSVQDYPQNDQVKFLFVGRVMKEKGIDELFAAMRMLNEEGIRCNLDVVGGFDEDYSEIIRQHEEEGWLKYHGFQNDVRPFIGASDCFVLPSYHEGMANTNLECASSARPVITSNIPGCKEAVIDGVSGLLCEPKNVDSLYHVMKQMTEMSVEARRNMGQAGRKHMEDVFDKKKVVEETLHTLRK